MSNHHSISEEPRVAESGKEPSVAVERREGREAVINMRRWSPGRPCSRERYCPSKGARKRQGGDEKGKAVRGSGFPLDDVEDSVLAPGYIGRKGVLSVFELEYLTLDGRVNDSESAFTPRGCDRVP